jgi:anti-sigma regulatory factor (Ser/Thr protein kinase)
LQKDFRSTLEAPQAARDAVAAEMVGISEDAVSTARLLTTELVTNSVVHGLAGSTETVGLNVDLDERRLRVEVSERALGTPKRKDASEEGGYGLGIVDALASRWGTHRDGKLNVTWFELDLRRATALQMPR